MSMFIAVLLSYFIGSIPTAYIFVKLIKGVDIRNYGSGNVGATNAFRVLGKSLGIVVLLLDIIKGIIPLTIIGDLLNIDTILSRVTLGLIVVAGHNWTIFLKFKGGKGIATSLGVLIGLTIQFSFLRSVLLLCVAIWIIAFLVSGIVSLSSMIAGVALPLIMVMTSQPLEVTLLGVIFCVFIILRHRPNIQRILAGTESRVNWPFKRTGQ